MQRTKQVTTLTGLINELILIRANIGDVPLKPHYWCGSSNDAHESKGIEVVVIDKAVSFYPVRLEDQIEDEADDIEEGNSLEGEVINAEEFFSLLQERVRTYVTQKVCN